jgi:hypothetical protein
MSVVCWGYEAVCDNASRDLHLLLLRHILGMLD